MFGLRPTTSAKPEGETCTYNYTINCMSTTSSSLKYTNEDVNHKTIKIFS